MGEYVKKIGMRRILIMLLGNVFLGMGVSIFKFAGLGNDAYNAMMMALSMQDFLRFSVWAYLSLS